MPPKNDNQRPVFNPNWLFATIVVILLFHYVFLGVSLSICIWGIRLNFLRLLEVAPVTHKRFTEDRASQELEGLCEDIDDQFRNARNKAIEIILALLVPTSTVIGSYMMKKKRDDAQPPDDDDPTAGQP